MAVYTDKSEQELVNEMAGYGQHQYSLQEALGVYTGIDPYRFQPVELLNYRNGTSYKTFQEALFNNLKTTLGLTGTHGSNLFSAQELLFKAKEAGIGLNEVVNSYLLYDKFTTAVAAGSVNNTSAEPTGGVRTVTDTGNKLSIASGKLHLAGNTGSSDPGIWYPSIARVAGRIVLAEATITSGTNVRWGSATASGATTSTAGINIAATTVALMDGGAGANVGTVVAGTTYQLAYVLRTAGVFLYIKGGIYTYWTLLWVGKTSTNTPIYPGILPEGASDSDFDNERIPVSLWLPTPLAYDTFTRANGALGSTESVGPDSQGVQQLGWTGSTWAVSSNAAVGTPVTLGSDLVTNGGFDTNTTGWTANASATLSSETGGQSGNCLQVLNGAAAQGYASQQLTTVVGKWYKFECYIKNGLSAGRINIGTSLGGTQYLGHTEGQAGSFGIRTRSFFATGTATFLGLGPSTSVQNDTMLFDTVSFKELTLTELFASITTSTKDYIADVNVTMNSSARGTQCGMILNLDSASSPQNFIIAYHDRDSAKLVKCVAGTYSIIISAAATYAAGATLRVIKDGTSYQLFYNNAKVGSTSTISDAGIVDNTLHGLFSTDTLNSLDTFQIFPRGTSNEYAQLDSF